MNKAAGRGDRKEKKRERTKKKGRREEKERQRRRERWKDGEKMIVRKRGGKQGKR